MEINHKIKCISSFHNFKTLIIYIIYNAIMSKNLCCEGMEFFTSNALEYITPNPSQNIYSQIFLKSMFKTGF